jgi:hypothetical protein
MNFRAKPIATSRLVWNILSDRVSEGKTEGDLGSPGGSSVTSHTYTHTVVGFYVTPHWAWPLSPENLPLKPQDFKRNVGSLPVLLCASEVMISRRCMQKTLKVLNYSVITELHDIISAAFVFNCHLLGWFLCNCWHICLKKWQSCKLQVNTKTCWSWEWGTHLKSQLLGRWKQEDWKFKAKEPGRLGVELSGRSHA